jgi:hypothetical protein
MRRLVVAAVVLACPTVANANGVIIPPARVDIAPVTMSKGATLTSGFHLTAGLHWASLDPRRKNSYDVGIGYIHEQFPTSGVGLPPSADCGPELEHSPWQLHGAYLELSRRMSGSKWTRSWLGVRGELLYATVNGDTRAGAGLTSRMAWELYAPVSGGSGNAVGLGNFAVGMFMELSYRRLPSGISGTAATAGVSMRLPFFVAGR